MTEFPQLGDALEAAARRHYAPSRLRRARRALPPLVVAAAAVAALALVVLRPAAGPSPDERPVQPAPAAATFEEHFEAFRRPRRESDVMPTGKNLPFGHTRGPMKELDPERSRLAATLGDIRVYLAPVPGETPSVCMLAFIAGSPTSGSCTTLEAAADGSTPMASLGRRPGPGRLGLTEALFPDGVRDVRLTLLDGTVLSPELDGNVLLVKHDEQVTSMAWTGPSGKRHALGAPDPDANENFEDRGCVEAEPVPAEAEAEAERAARDAVPPLLPDDDGTVVAARRGDEDPRLESMERACGAEVLARVRVFDFDTGSITVARLGGRFRVFSVLERS